MKKQTDTIHRNKDGSRCGNICLAPNQSAIQEALTTVYICDNCKTKWIWTKNNDK